MKKLKFKISEEMVKKLSLTEIAVLASISKMRNNNITEFRYAKCIAAEINVSDATVERAISSLKKQGAFEKVERVQVQGCDFQRNKYFFTPLDSKFILVSDDIFTLGLKADEIGFLIKAKAVCFENGLSILGNKEKIAAFIGISKGRCTRMINELMSKGLINYETSKLTLTNELFIDNSPLAIKYIEIKKKRANRKAIIEQMAADQITSGTILGKKLKALIPKATFPYAATRALLFGKKKIRVKQTISL